MEKKTKKKDKYQFLAISLPFIILLGAFFYVNPTQWYLFKTGFGTKHISMKQTARSMKECSLEELKQDKMVTFDQSMMLVNTEYMLSEDFKAETKQYKDSGLLMNRCIIDAYAKLSVAVSEATEDKLYVSSSVRNKEEQAKLYEEDSKNATIPGASEHETGLCLDVYVAHYAGDGFLRSKAGQFVNSNCYQYGFIIRYPSYGKRVTGIPFEPWHIRYVGQPHATIISCNRLTLEEYILSLEEGICYEAEGYYITRQRTKDGKIQIPDDCESYIISLDNTGCYIITGKKKIAKALYLETV